jgi:hypothetical protein
VVNIQLAKQLGKHDGDGATGRLSNAGRMLAGGRAICWRRLVMPSSSITICRDCASSPTWSATAVAPVLPAKRAIFQESIVDYRNFMCAWREFASYRPNLNCRMDSRRSWCGWSVKCNRRVFFAALRQWPCWLDRLRSIPRQRCLRAQRLLKATVVPNSFIRRKVAVNASGNGRGVLRAESRRRGRSA